MWSSEPLPSTDLPTDHHPRDPSPRTTLALAYAPLQLPRPIQVRHHFVSTTRPCPQHPPSTTFPTHHVQHHLLYRVCQPTDPQRQRIPQWGCRTSEGPMSDPSDHPLSKSSETVSGMPSGVPSGTPSGLPSLQPSTTTHLPPASAPLSTQASASTASPPPSTTRLQSTRMEFK